MNPKIEEQLETFKASPEPVRGLRDAVADRQVKQTPNYFVEYGVREDDGSMIFHFYPPNTDWSEYPPKKIGSWPTAYQMADRLERAMPIVFDVQFIKARYTEELASFCIIVRGLGRSPDPWPLVNRFFSLIDAPL